jgi:ribosomal protein L28
MRDARWIIKHSKAERKPARRWRTNLHMMEWKVLEDRQEAHSKAAHKVVQIRNK